MSGDARPHHRDRAAGAQTGAAPADHSPTHCAAEARARAASAAARSAGPYSARDAEDVAKSFAFRANRWALVADALWAGVECANRKRFMVLQSSDTADDTAESAADFQPAIGVGAAQL